DLAWGEVRRGIHEELDGLSERYRGPLTLCYLEGRTLDQAAAQLGLAKGALRVRLERARAVLRARPVRRGLGPAAALITSAWPAAGDVPAALLNATAAAGVAVGRSLTPLVPARVLVLTEGVRNAMFTSRLQAVVTVLAVFALTGLAVAGLAFPT